MRKSGILAQSILVLGATMAINLGGFFFQAIASRKLGVADYGTLYSLMAACALVGSPATIVTPVIARFSAEFETLGDQQHVRGLFYSVLRGAGYLGFLYIVLGLIFIRPLASFFHASSLAIALSAIVTAVSMSAVMLRAIAQGTQQYITYAGSLATDAVMRVVGLIIFLAVGLGFAGGLLGFLIGLSCGLIYAVFVLLRRYGSVPEEEVRYDWRRIVITTGGAAALAITMTLMGNADVILVKHFFPGSEAGLYSVAALGGKILFFVAGFIPTVLLPQATERHTRGERTSHVLLMSCVMLLIIAAIGLLGFKLYGIPLIHILAGTKYDAAFSLLVWYGAAMVLLALINALATYGIATHRLFFAIPLVLAALATIGVILLVHPTLLAIVKILFAGNAVAAIVTAGGLLIQAKRPRPYQSGLG